ncbi:MAG: serine/threonine-protein kinase [Myxococcaceae bacterium]|nr:serine/threonine-protein kinase [Myxococcaceae bacterium]
MGTSPSSTVRLPLPEQLLSDKYRLLSRLGQGGMGYVFLAEKLHLGTRVAIKFLDPEPNADATRLKRFLQEARVAVEVNHPGAAQLLDAGHDEVTGSLFLVFEYVEGKDVREVLQDEGRLTFDEARDICIQTAEVLAFAHARGIVHRDIKPENVRMRRDLGGARVKVLDFGIARLVNQGAVRLTAEGMLAGTPRYMAPEQIRDLPLDARTDVYALGLLLFEMLSGVPAFDGKNLSQVLLRQMNEPLPTLKSVDLSLGHPQVDAFLARACAKQAIERFQNMEAFVGALKSLQVSAWPSPRKKLVPGADAPTAPNRPQAAPTAEALGPVPEPVGHHHTSPNLQQREATLFVDEESARAKRPDAGQVGVRTEPSRPMPDVQVPWETDPSKLPTSPSRPAVGRSEPETLKGGAVAAAPGGTAVAPTFDPQAEATWRAPETPKPASRWWLWFLLLGALAAAVTLALVKSGVFQRAAPVG